MKNVNTISGAAVAMLISLVTAFLAVMNQENVNGVADISEVTWWILGGGALLTFLKDYQAISSRRLINRLTKTGDGGGEV